MKNLFFLHSPTPTPHIAFRRATVYNGQADGINFRAILSRRSGRPSRDTLENYTPIVAPRMTRTGKLRLRPPHHRRPFPIVFCSANVIAGSIRANLYAMSKCPSKSHARDSPFLPLEHDARSECSTRVRAIFF